MTDIFEQNQEPAVSQPSEPVSPSPASAPTSDQPKNKEEGEKPTEVKESLFKKLIPLIGFIVLIVVLFLLIFKVILPFFKKKQGISGGKEISLTY